MTKRIEDEPDLGGQIMNLLRRHPEGMGAVAIATKLWTPVSKVILALGELQLTNQVIRVEKNNRWFIYG